MRQRMASGSGNAAAVELMLFGTKKSDNEAY
jgi:hypothetical protein